MGSGMTEAEQAHVDEAEERWLQEVAEKCECCKEWAVSRIVVGEEALSLLADIEKWEIEMYAEFGEFMLPDDLRERLSKIK